MTFDKIMEILFKLWVTFIVIGVDVALYFMWKAK